MDTGALECYSDLNLMATQGIVKREPRDIGHLASHLSQSFTYFAKDAVVAVLDANGATREFLTTIICVENWRRSPFVAINPNRTFLLGRRLLLELRPRVTLDFDARQSEVQFKEQIA